MALKVSRIDDPVTQRVDLLRIRLQIPGIALGDAFDALDTFGQLIEFKNVARFAGGSGVIAAARFWDYDDEAKNKTLFLFTSPPVIPASDAAWSLADAELAKAFDYILFDTWTTGDAINGIISVVKPALYYVCDAETTSLWGAFQTAGADNIAASAVPEIELLVARD